MTEDRRDAILIECLPWASSGSSGDPTACRCAFVMMKAGTVMFFSFKTTRWLRTAVAGAAAIGCVSYGLGAEKRSPPNIVFVLAEDKYE